jgi:NADH dehydrogenase [ubiquinone] 1 alpha subcomplex assembly factor 1
MAFSYRAKFDTEAGRRQEFRLPIKVLQATWFGRKQPNAPAIDGADILSLGFTLADKKAVPFKLDVAWIGTAGDVA